MDTLKDIKCDKLVVQETESLKYIFKEKKEQILYNEDGCVNVWNVCQARCETPLFWNQQVQKIENAKS